MKTNKLMDSIRDSISPETKKQTELSVSIANRIYEILEEKNLSQKDLARLLGKTETEVSRWLSGTHNLTMATIAKISTALGVDIIQTTQSHSIKTRNKKNSVAISSTLATSAETLS